MGLFPVWPTCQLGQSGALPLHGMCSETRTQTAIPNQQQVTSHVEHPQYKSYDVDTVEPTLCGSTPECIPSQPSMGKRVGILGKLRDLDGVGRPNGKDGVC